MTNCDARVERWLRMVETGEVAACKEQHMLAAHIRRCFETEDIYVDKKLLEDYFRLTKYFSFERLFEWEEFCLALHLCTFWRKTYKPRWPDLFLLLGRGAGKDGYIAIESLCLVSPYNRIPHYDVDICANAEEQAMRPVNDILEVLNDIRHMKKLSKHFRHTKQMVQGVKNKGVIKGRTSNPKSKDGMRSGIIIFNELHQYQDYKNIKAFVTGQGKRPHPRRLLASANGDVREGPLDDYLTESMEILRREKPDNGFLPFICRLDDKAEADDKAMWPKANPSLIYLPDLMSTIEKEHVEWKNNPVANADFMTKRMNLPQSDTEIAVTDWENILATNKPLPDLTGRECVAGIDYASISDFASVNLHFKIGAERYDINHSWLCLKSKDLHRLKIPWREWADPELGLLTVVDDVNINPDLIANWLLQKMELYQIKKLALDNHRYALVAASLRKIGFGVRDFENVKLVRPNDIMKTHPVIEDAFLQRQLFWGDNPLLRWATNNTKLVRSSRGIGADTGNHFYAKIEAKSRKTDPFMAFVACMTIEDELPEENIFADIPVIVC